MSCDRSGAYHATLIQKGVEQYDLSKAQEWRYHGPIATETY